MHAKAQMIGSSREDDLTPSGNGWPRITIVTPVKNASPYLGQAITSVLSQGYPNLEYIIVDGGSTDGSVAVIREHAEQLAWWCSEPDQGMYHALNKGFSRSTGEVMGWISATDMLHARALFTVGSVFRALPRVEWITGIPSYFDEHGVATTVGPPMRWSRMRFLAGVNRYIQQESTFWRRRLWQVAGGYVDASRRNASDFELWVRFFRHARLHTVESLIGGFRFHPDSIGLGALDECHAVHEEVIARELDHLPYGWLLRLFCAVNTGAMAVPGVRGVWWRTVVRALRRLPGPDRPPLIVRRGRRWVVEGSEEGGPSA